MLEVKSGNLFESRAQTLVNTVNCVGVMGKGIALEFRKRFPAMHEEYVRRCLQDQVRLGEPYLYKSPNLPWILNFPTKEHWRSVARLSDIVGGLDFLLAHYREWGITSLAVPPLGCGLGQLEWKVVGPTLVRYLEPMPIPVKLYAPFGTPESQLRLDFLRSNLSSGAPERIRPAWVALAEILRRIEAQPYHWPIGRVIFQKVAYVATVAGLPTGFVHARGSYGPFSPDVKPALSRMANNGLLRERRAGQLLKVEIGPALNDAIRAYSSELQNWEEIIARTANLFLRLDTELAEAVATVIFAAQELQPTGEREPPTERQVIDEVIKWKQKRKPPLDEGLIVRTTRSLAVLGWIRVRGDANLDPLIPELAALEA